MHQLLRPLAVFAGSSALSLAILYVAGDEPAGSAPMEAAASSTRGHDLARLRVVQEALAPVAESYVEPERVDHERMFVAALEAVERLVPEVMFHREGTHLTVHVGDFRDMLPIPTVTDSRTLLQQLRVVATLLETNLSADDIPRDDRDIEPFALVEFAMGNGMLATLDPHSALLPPEQSREMDVENRGEFGGLGINIEIRDDRLMVDDALEGKPAALAGVRAGDHIRRIDGQSTINVTIDEAVDLLRGPIGAPVTLELVRDDGASSREVRVERANIKINEVEAYPLPGGMGYVRIPSFHSTVHHDLTSHLRRLAREQGELRGLVLDLRDNPGGYLNQAIAVADAFLADGEIVSTRGPYDRRPSREEATTQGSEEPYPIVVLVNANSASASEIVAGALRNNQRAVIVGERTFGKGSVQNLHALPYDSKLKITIAHYLTPGEHSIQSVGIPADIELVPTTVGPREEDGETVLDALLFERERVKRESDLSEHLERRDLREQEPIATARYLSNWDDARLMYGPPDLAGDEELAFALDLLRVAPAPRRGDMLSAAGPLVQRFSEQQDARIVAAMASLGVDWSDGTPNPAPDVQVALDLGERGGLVPGQIEPVVLSVTNNGTTPVFRLAAVLSDHEALEGMEFFFGRVDPGETRTWTRELRLDHGWPAEIGAVTISLRDGTGSEVRRQEARVAVAGHDRPHLAWAWQMHAPSDDGTIDPGDVVRVELDVRNQGSGASLGATGRIRNRAGRALDILTGTVDAGRMIDDAGQPCAVVEPGWEAGRVVGEADLDHPRVVARLAPEYDEGCRRVLAAGESWSGAFEVKILEALEGGYRIDLSIEDSASYDHGTVIRGGFYRYYSNEEQIRFGLGVPAPGVPWREPPRIEVTARPDLETHAEAVVLSGRVTDVDGLDHVLVYADEEKVFFEGSQLGQALPSIPFTANVRVDPGMHTISVMARDTKGFSTSFSHVVQRRSKTYTAEAEGE